MMQKALYFICFFLATSLLLACGQDDDDGGGTSAGQLQLNTARVGTVSIISGSPQVPPGNTITLAFNAAIDVNTLSEIVLAQGVGTFVELNFETLDNARIIEITPATALTEGEVYTLEIGSGFKGAAGESYSGVELSFTVSQPGLTIVSLRENNRNLSLTARNTEVAAAPEFDLVLSHDIDAAILEDRLVLIGDQNYPLSVTKTAAATYRITTNTNLKDLIKFNLLFPASIGTDAERDFTAVSYVFYTQLDPTPDFPIISDDELMTLVQSQTFKYFWDFGHPVSGMARERNSTDNTVTTGGTGFGLMAMIVGVERGFITRQEAVVRWQTVIDFLEDADRFHGAWSHWLNGNTGTVIPFGAQDNGGDIVETAFLVQGMLAVRQYLNPSDPTEAALAAKITTLWEEVEWNWYTKGENRIYWHWSPQFDFAINLPVSGHNETQIVYILAAGSPTYGIEKVVYDNGYTRNGDMANGNTFYDYTLPLGEDLGGPLFFSHYSYLGLDPRNLSDVYTNYFTQNRNHTLINRAYCIANPQDYVGYSDQIWGLTASDNDMGYSAHSPTNDLGVITPTAAISSMPFTPDESMTAMRAFYYQLGDRLWGEYGFYDAINPTAGWVADSYLAIDQGPIICGIENHRTALLWDLFMTAPEVQAGLTNLEFSY